MSEEVIKKKIKSFSLKIENAEKIERIAYEKKRKQSEVVDNMVEDFNDVDK
jgi:hypothetical protein